MLKQSSKFAGIDGPLLLVVMDGYGINKSSEGNAIAKAYKPTLDKLFASYPNILLKAHGLAVGLPSDDDMGNSEVGHNALGSGQVYAQGAKLVNESLATGALFEGNAWKEIISNVQQHKSTLHFLGLFSDGNVHSHMDHLKAMIANAKKEGIRKVRVHILLDGRDVGETSALDYVDPFEAFLTELQSSDFDVKIASGGGRMCITMDRYQADWSMVERGWKTHVLGEGRQFASAREAILAYRAEAPVIDQDLPPFVIAEEGAPVGCIEDNDSVIFFNFRGDRAIEISRAFEDESFDNFDRVRFPHVTYAGMLQYDGDLFIPKRFLVAPPEIRDTSGQHFAESGITQFACSETQKFGHVTYFWNGNRSGKFNDKLETYVEVQSDRVPFEQRPWMKAAEITDQILTALQSGKQKFVRLNFANGDMVGHTGDYRAATLAIETVDLCLARLLPALDKMKGVAIITADHGNADEMYEISKKTGQPVTENGRIKAKTSHTLNPVPCIFYDNFYRDRWNLSNVSGARLSNIAATVSNLLGFEAHEKWDSSLIELK